MVLTKCCRVWRKYKPRSILLESKEVPDHALLFESDVIAILDPVEVEILRKEISYTESVGAYGTLGVLALDYNHAMVKYLVLVTGCQAVGKIKDTEVFKLTQTSFVPLSAKAPMELVVDVGKLLASGKFYFGHPSFGSNFDLLSCAQKQGVDQPHFYWNKSLLAYLQRFGVDVSRWVFRTICGHVHISTVYAGEKQAKLCLFSRLSCERAGTRFHVRGINDDGHVANFVETEEAIYVDDSVASFVQVRGLVPLFWDQPGLQTGGGMAKIRFSRGYSCTHPAFERHFEWCLLHYGPTLCLNLLGTRDMERMLSVVFQEHFSQLSDAYCAVLMHYDYHKTIKTTNGNIEFILSQTLLPELIDFRKRHGFYLSKDGDISRQQTATVRTNCLDCLDRTNSVQSFLGQQILSELMVSLGLLSKQQMLTRFKQQLQSAWSQSGDSLSRLYTGTGALKFEGKNKLKDGARSVQRTIRNNFLDTNKQEAIDVLLLSNACRGELGFQAKALLHKADQLAPIPLKRMMCDRWKEFTQPEKVRVAIGTWNVNGGTRIRSIALKNQSLSDWLLDGPVVTGASKEHPEDYDGPPDVYAVGFEELVGLTASNIVSASSTNRREWGLELQKVLSRDQPYELLTAEQLVGVCLYIFVQPKYIPYVRDVAVTSVKTGMSGKAGNKGGVAIRFLLHSTSFCFVCSHFAAHQTKVMERNQDYADICKKISFPHGHTVDTHDYVFWCGDLNYRIELPTTLAKEHISHQRWDRLHKQDQLIKQKKLNKIFQGYIEGELNFAPTYKYDEFSDDYDTSEKGRTPAWCDRVLWKRRRRHKQISGQKTFVSLYHKETSSQETECSLDFGPHPNDAWPLCLEELEADMAEEGYEEFPSHRWHPGRLVYYNRAELKQSDHRPVFALIDVDLYRVDAAKRQAVKEEVLQTLGPSDPTIVVEEKDKGHSVSVSRLLEVFKTYGEVVLVRVTESTTLVTFRDSPCALAATAFHGQEIEGVTMNVVLHSSCPLSSLGEDATPTKDQNQTMTILTGAKLKSAEEMEEEEEENVMEFSFQAEDDKDDTDNTTQVLDGSGSYEESDASSEGVTAESTSSRSSHSPAYPPVSNKHSNGNKENSPANSPNNSPRPPPRPKLHTSLSVASTSSLSPPSTSPTKKPQGKPEGVSRPPPPRPVPPRPSLPPKTLSVSASALPGNGGSRTSDNGSAGDNNSTLTVLPDTQYSSVPTPPARKKRTQRQKTLAEKEDEPESPPPSYTEVMKMNKNTETIQAPPARPTPPTRPPPTRPPRPAPKT